MVYVLKNIEKFLNDHPELSERRDGIMTAAQKEAEEGGILTGVRIKRVLGDVAGLFFEEVGSNPEHIRIGLEGIRGR